MKVLQFLAELKFAGRLSPPNHLEDLRDPEALVLDLRNSTSFLQGFVPGSLNFPTIESFGLFPKGELLGKTRTYLVGDSPESLRQVAGKLKQMGLPPLARCFDDSLLGAWHQQFGDLSVVEEIDADTLAVRVAAWKTLVIDVGDANSIQRSWPSESIRIPLTELSSSLMGLPVSTRLTVVCDSSRPGSLAASILWKLGYRQLSVSTKCQRVRHSQDFPFRRTLRSITGV